MAEMNVRKAFKLNHNGKEMTFAAGRQEIPDDIAGHWWVVAHTFAKEGDAKYAEEACAKADAAERDAAEVTQEAARLRALADAACEAYERAQAAKLSGQPLPELQNGDPGYVPTMQEMVDAGYSGEALTTARDYNPDAVPEKTPETASGKGKAK